MVEKNPFKYGSVEYKAEETKRYIDDFVKQIKQTEATLNAEVSPAMGVKKCNYMGNVRSSWFDYFGYKTSYGWDMDFDENNREHIEQTFKKALVDINAKWNDCEKIHKENEKAIDHNMKMIKVIKDFMALAGINEHYSVYDYPSNRHRNKKRISKTSGFVSDIHRLFKVNDGFIVAQSEFESHKKKLKEWKENLIKQLEQKEKEKVKSDEELRKLAKAVSLAEQYNITKYKDNAELFELVDAKAKEDWVNKYDPDGKERLDIYVRGNFYEGFTSD